MFFYIALYEFICAQSPHSMKGFLIGLSFAIKGFFLSIAALLFFPFSHVTSSFSSCGVLLYYEHICGCTGSSSDLCGCDQRV